MKKIPSKKHLARVEKIKEVALDLFLNKGYEQTSLSDIIKLSGGSYSDIYSAFENKHGLFVAILDDLRKCYFESLNEMLDEVKSSDLRTFLISFGLYFYKAFNNKNSIILGKIIYSQVYSMDKHLSVWIEDTKKNIVDKVITERLLESSNPYVKNNAPELAELFCTMIKEPYYHFHILINKEMLSESEQQKHVEFVVDFFLKAINN